MNYGWTLLGDSIKGQRSFFGLGFSISLSADGTVLAVGTDTFSWECRVLVFYFDEVQKSWNKGSELQWEEDFSYDTMSTTVKISSNGKVLAVGYRHNDYGYDNVFVYDVNTISKHWKIREKVDIADTARIDTFSLSSNGCFLALFVHQSDTQQSHVDTHEYHKADGTWKKVGQTLVSSLTTQSGLLYRKEVELSSDGSVLVSWDSKIDFQTFDKSSDSWIQSSFKTPDVDELKSNSIVALSADALTFAITSPEGVKSFHLTSTSQSSVITSCSGDKHLFEFTVTPDQFPEDISWFL